MFINREDVLDAINLIGKKYLDLFFDLEEIEVVRVVIDANGLQMVVNRPTGRENFTLQSLKHLAQLNHDMLERAGDPGEFAKSVVMSEKLFKSIRGLLDKVHRITFGASLDALPDIVLVPSLWDRPQQLSDPDLLYFTTTARDSSYLANQDTVVLSIAGTDIQLPVSAIKAVGQLDRVVNLSVPLADTVFISLEKRVSEFTELMDDLEPLIGTSAYYRLTRTNLEILNEYSKHYTGFDNLRLERPTDV